MKYSMNIMRALLSVLLGMAMMMIIAGGASAAGSTLPTANPWAWGCNLVGQLGNGTTSSSSTPVQVSNLSGKTIAAISAGEQHALALESNGTVCAWGNNGSGQLGNGTFTSSSIPVQVNSVPGKTVTAISGGGSHSLSLMSDGTVYAWGYNGYGELGTGNLTDSSSPVQVNNSSYTGFLSNIKAVAAGEEHSLALDNNGTVWAWGNNTYGQLGNGTSTQSNIPVQVINLPAIKAIAAGHYHSMALDDNGDVWAWGDNGSGQLGNGQSGTDPSTGQDIYSDIPVRVSGLPAGQIVAISGGGSYSLALDSNGNVWAWGNNAYGQLGIGSNTNSSIPVRISSLAGKIIEDISAGNTHSLALDSNGNVWAWGNNAYGQLGNGNVFSSTVPVNVININSPSEIAAGNDYSLALVNSTGTAPVVTTQPFSQTVDSGSDVTFSAAASGSPVPTVQWQVSTDGTHWTDISGATGVTYTLSSVTALQNGSQYRAIFTNSAGSATSNVATLTVNGPPVITAQPASTSVTSGANATFIAAASGDPAPTVQWQVRTDSGSSFTDISGATTTTYSFTTSSGDNGNQYQAVFSNSSGTATSNAATLTVTTNEVPVITTQPVDQHCDAGTDATFTAIATGVPAPTVQWQVSPYGSTGWSDITEANSTTLRVGSVTMSMNGSRYQAIFTNSAGTAVSYTAVLWINGAEPPTITLQPQNLAINSGETAAFTTAAETNLTTTMQWQVSTDGGTNFNNISGATATTYRFSVDSSDNGNQYRAIFTNSAGSVTSNAATLTVNSPPAITLQPEDQTGYPGDTATFEATASGSPVPTVQWQVSTNGGTNFNNIYGATDITYSFSVDTSDNGNQYRAIFTNSAGSGTSNAATLTVNNVVEPIDTSLVLTSSESFAASGQAVTLIATVNPANSGSASPSGTVQFMVDGAALTSYNIPLSGLQAKLKLSSLSIGVHTIGAIYSGDSNYNGSTAAPLTLYVYQPTQFVIWGGNLPKLSDAVKVGRDYMFWGDQWYKQVTDGDYHAGSSCKGFASQLDGSTWETDAGNSCDPPSKIGEYIGVIVATHITRDHNKITGNVAEVAVLRVDNPSFYTSDPGHSSSGVAAGIISIGVSP